jgi:hypothetical protein
MAGLGFAGRSLRDLSVLVVLNGWGAQSGVCKVWLLGKVGIDGLVVIGKDIDQGQSAS